MRTRLQFLSEWIALLIVFGTIHLAVGGPTTAPSKPKQIVVVGDRGFRPFHFVGPDGQSAGIVVDLWALWAQKTGITVIFKCDYDWSDALAAVRGGQADVVGAIMKRPDREQWLDFPSPILRTDFYLYFHRDLHALKDLETLDETVVTGVVKDDYPEQMLKQLYPNRRTKAYPDHEALISAALRKEILVFILEPEVADYYFAIKQISDTGFKKASEPFLNEELFAGVAKGKTAISFWVKEGFSEISQKERFSIVRRWSYSEGGFTVRDLLKVLQSHPLFTAVVGAMLAYFSAIASVLAFAKLRPLAIIKLEEALRTALKIEWTLFGMKISVSLHDFLLLEYITFRHSVIDAWLRHYRPRVMNNFAALETVRTRASYTPLPLFVGDRLISNEDASLLENSLRAEISDTVVASRAPILISGEGGAGKTSTGIRFVHWICGPPDGLSCFNVPLLPVLIEEELQYPDGGEELALFNAIKGVVESLIESAMDAQLLTYLLTERRLCVLIDGLSEKTERTRRAIQARRSGFNQYCLVVTSRYDNDDCLGGVPIRVVKPTRIGGVYIAGFLNRYFLDKNVRQTITDSQFYEGCKRIALLTGNKVITPLFARLFADLMTRDTDGPEEQAAIDSIVTLIIAYVHWLNKGIKDNRRDDEKVLNVVEWLSWIEVKSEFMPRILTIGEVRKADTLGILDEDMFTYLEKRLGIITRMDAAERRLKISFDPIAEYCAAMYILAQAKEGKSRHWEEVLAFAERESMVRLLKSTGFLVACWEVFLFMKSNFGFKGKGKGLDALGKFVERAQANYETMLKEFTSEH